MSMHAHAGPGAAASFLGMWVGMMAAMMLPSLISMLCRYRQTVGGAGALRPASLTVLVAAGYFGVWAVVGMVAFPLAVALATLEMHPPAWAAALPIIVGVVILGAGTFQLSAWKARHLAARRAASAPGGRLSATAGTAWRHGLRLGFHCSASCAGLTAILLVIGLMDLRVMLIVTTAITLERLSPAGWRVAQAIGALCVEAGALLIVRAAMPM